MVSKIRMTKMSIVLVVTISGLLAYVFIAIPVMDQWKELNRRIEVVSLQYLRDTKTVNNFDEYKKLYTEYEAIARQAKTDEEEIAFFLKEIESFTANLNISINDIKPLPQERDKHTTILFIEIEMLSSMKDFIAFLHTIASSRTMIHIHKMSLSIISRRDDILTIKLVISKTFF